MAYPRSLLTEDEDIVREFHPHWRVLLMAILWTVVAIAVGVVSALAFDGAATWAGVAVAVLVVLVFALPRVIVWKFRLYVLTTERVIVRSGVISRESTEIPLENINNVLFSQSVIERLLGFGDVLIESAGSQGQSRLTDIPHPQEFQAEVYRVREDRSIVMKGTSGAPRDAVAQLESLADLHERGVISDEEFAEKKSKLLGDI